MYWHSSVFTSKLIYPFFPLMKFFNASDVDQLDHLFLEGLYLLIMMHFHTPVFFFFLMNKQHQETSGSFTACKVNNCIWSVEQSNRDSRMEQFSSIFPFIISNQFEVPLLPFFVDVGSCWELDKLTCCTFSLLMESCCNSCNNPTSELKPIGLNVY